jgi:hypothetical protein
MSFRFEQTKLWQSTLADHGDEPAKPQRDRLRTAFYSFRANAEVLVERIADALPDLTQHDITHLDALWETATLIAGDSYPMNPLEGFVLGGAILLHDAALCFEAYSGGINEIRSTVEWKDAFAAELITVPRLSEDEMRYNADFSALRSLHAKQAAKLTERGWLDPDTHQQLFLIEDSHLRKHLGQLIGEIASSHHWDIELVASKFRGQINAITPFPREWRIDPLKIACLLRCADAAHFNQERAPDFLHALIRRQGLSFKHWQAQNRIAPADLDSTDKSKSTLLLTSTRPFPVSDSASWWIAYDAACLIDKEIRASNALLEEQKSDMPTSFQVKRVKGVEAPERMAEHIRAEGWEPCAAMLHVGNVEKLIATLGGEELYGTGTDTFAIAVRELIQNARDAIQARRIVDNGFDGSVHIHLKREAQGVTFVVHDNGLGMSRRVLTGPLLDFGASFWLSALMREEFPGLRSSSFRSIGQFGIGFYSVFMIADQVSVASRRWDEGLEAVNQLKFENGITLRPLLIAAKPASFRSEASTEITLKLKDKVISENGKIEIKRNLMGATNLLVEVEDYLAALFAGLDVTVYFRNGDEDETLIHRAHPLKEQFHADWLRKLSFSRYQDSSVEKCINDNWSRLRPIYDNGACCGLAAISTHPSNLQDFLSVATVGGLATTVHGRGQRDFIGYIDYKPKSAKRDQGDFFASSSAMRTWATEQMRLLVESKPSPLEQCFAAQSFADFGIDPSPIMRICVVFEGKMGYLSLTELTLLLERMDVAIFKSNTLGDHAEYHHSIQQIVGRALICPLGSSKFYELILNSGVPMENFSVIDCLHRALVAQGKTPRWTREKNVAPCYFGLMDVIVVSTRNA